MFSLFERIREICIRHTINEDGWPTSDRTATTGCPIFATISSPISPGSPPASLVGGKVPTFADSENPNTLNSPTLGVVVRHNPSHFSTR
jgi:hypothetical protein